MDPPSPYKFPARDALQTLPAERVNARPVSCISTTTTTTSHKSSYSTDIDSRDVFTTPYASPTRRTKAALFAEATSPSKVSGFSLPQSPSLPEIHALKSHVRTNSDVQGLVKRFEHLDVRDRDAESAERRNRQEAELRRAQIAREEAESDVKRLREEVRRLKKEGDDGRERERRVAKRLEVVMEEFGTSREARDSQHTVYEKELRKARKEAFKSSSAVLKLQEELKSARNTLRMTQSGFDLEKQKMQRKEQERFEMEYRLTPLQEEVDMLRQKLRVVEEEREALKTNLKEEEVARIAAEGMIALPVSQDMDLEVLSSPRKQLSPMKNVMLSSLEDKENIHVSPKKIVDSKRLADELDVERRRRMRAEGLVDFMRIECMFRCCSCNTATRLGHEYTLDLDAELAAGVEKVRAGMESILSMPANLAGEDEMDVEMVAPEKTEATAEEGAVVAVEIAMEMTTATTSELAVVEHVDTTVQHEPMEIVLDSDPWDETIDRSTTMTAESPKQTQSSEDPLCEVEAAFEPQTSPQTADPDAIATSIPQPQTPPRNDRLQHTPGRHQPSIRTVTTTTTIPMHFTPVTKHLPPVFDAEDAENIPPTPNSTILADGSEVPVFDRAAALAAIQYRRGRAKSIANGQATPRKQMMEGVKERRDISAPALGQAAHQATGSASAPKPFRSVRGR